MNAEPSFTPRSDFLRILSERGFLHQCTHWEALDDALGQGPVTAYIGFDATADSLHVGHLLSIMALRWLQKTGHRPIVLMGGGTTRIGDPSFRDSTRPLLDDAQIAANIAGIRRVFDRFLRFGEGPRDAVMVNNADWLDGLGYIPFLRDFGRHFSVNRMLTFDSVRQRLDREQPLTFLEFNYMLLQAYDFVELSRRFGCRLQMGGSDQWGNIVNGVELGRRVDERDLFGLTTSLLTTASGAKMGKTAGGAVWLNRERLAAYDFWQFWRNTEDADVGRFLRLFTELPLDEIARLEALGGSEINEAKKLLATEVTTLVHGPDAAQEAAETARRTFEEGSGGEALPRLLLPKDRLAEGTKLVDLLVASGLAASKGEARRLIAGGGARVNGAVVSEDEATLSLQDLGEDGVIKLSAGRKRHALVCVQED
ncbi:tyrosine--tRNA ligase [Telmatospirillum sp. J64-1]|uniref:tyrosine--tRNA ligase n=1 Tax=Telmatospirillum sp. J64-1 TaxID=2502183 RepID=UPI0021078A37|nr:tyrosine--tRNA ligase [Telmatospirillum sp. J64-1]